MDFNQIFSDPSSFVGFITGNNIASPEVYSADIVAINLIITLFLGIIIALTYKHVHKGISYSQSYVYSIVLVSMVVAMAMMVIGNDVTRAFALLGTFTIIRYRTAVKDPKDTAFIFIALVVGLAIGSSNYAIGITSVVVICLTAIILDYLNFGSVKKLDQVLYLTVDGNVISSENLQSVLKKYFKNVNLLNVNYQSENGKMLYSYNVTLRKKMDPTLAVNDILKLNGVFDAEILTSQNIVEF